MLQMRHIIQILISTIILTMVGCRKSASDNNFPPNNFETADTLVPPAPGAGMDELNNYAIAQWQKGNYQEALTYLSIVYKQAKDKRDEAQMANTLNSLGLVHWRLEDNKSAMECYVEAAQLAKKQNLTRLLGLTHTNRSLILKEKNFYISALEHSKQAIDIFQEDGTSRDLAIAYNNHGQIFKNQSLMDSARFYYEKALSIYDTIDYKDGMAATYYNLADVFTSEKMEQQAIQAAEKSLELGIESESKVRISEGYLKLSETYEHFSNADSALKYHKKYSQHQIQLLMSNQSDKLAEYQANLGHEVKLLRIQNLENEKTIVRNQMLIVIGGILILVLIASFLIYRRISAIRLKKKRLEFELENSNRILQIKKKELKNYIVDLTQKNQLIAQLQQELHNENSNYESQVAELINQKILTDEDWEKFKSKFQTIYPNFFSKIKLLKSGITEAEIRFLVLLRLKLTPKEMANTLGISPQSVRVTKLRLKKKLQQENYDSVEDFLAEL